MAAPEHDTEIWQTIGAAPAYEVSSLGRVRRGVRCINYPAGRQIKLSQRKDGYVQVHLMADGRRTTFLVHRLVCDAFHGPAPSPAHEAAHRNGSRAENVRGNIRWATPTENCADKKLHGTTPDHRGSKSPLALVDEAAVRIIRSTKRYPGVLPDLAARFGLTVNTVCSLRTRGNRKWPHIPLAI